MLGQHHFHHTWERCNGNTLKSTTPISPTLGSAHAHPPQLGREDRLNLPQLRAVLRINSTVNQLLCSVQVLGVVDFKVCLPFFVPSSSILPLCPVGFASKFHIELCNYSDKTAVDNVMEDLRHGFWISFFSLCAFKSVSTNKLSTTQKPSVINNYFPTKIAHGRTARPIPTSPFSHLYVS